MTLFTDSNEPAVVEVYIQSHGVATERLLLNRPTLPPRPDYGFYTADGSYIGVSRKQAGEFAGNIDACEAQILDEMNCDYMALLIEGIFSPAPGGFTYTWELSLADAYLKSHDGIHGFGPVRAVRRLYRIPYKRVREKLAEFQDAGIQVIYTQDIEDTALALVCLYRQAQKPTASLTTFKRLIPEKYRLDEKDEAKKRVALQIMGAVPGAGEEIALALVDAGIASVRDLISHIDGGAGAAIAKWPLRSGKRTIGPAAVKKIAEALGC